jgi:formylglycine-generating enzyme required for sulfatase activity
MAVELAPIIGRIELSVAPEDAEVLVNGTPKGRGSRTLALTAREHRLTVRKPGYSEQNMTITPRPEHEQSLSVRLLTVDQAYWATRPPEIRTPLGAQMRMFRPDAQFQMGAPRREPGRRANEAERLVRLERPFYLGTREVTNEEFRRFRGEHSSGAAQGNTLDMDDQPVANVSWEQAAFFCNWLSRQEGLPLFYLEQDGMVVGADFDAHGYRLPTEAEWAYVARITQDGEVRMFPWGSDAYPPASVVENYSDQSAATILSFTLSNYNDGFPASAPVGSFAAGPRGLFDLGGNVSEWIHDLYEIRTGRGEPELDPTGPLEGDRHVIRGASWTKASRSELRLSYRDAGSDGAMDTGFRLARYVDKARVEP